MMKYALLAGIVLAATSVTAKANPYEDHMFGLHRACDAGDRRACVRFGIEIGRHQDRAAEWHQHHPDWYWYEH